MTETLRTLLPRAGALCRTCAVTIISGLWRRHSIKEIDARLRARPLRDQVVITAAVLAGLFLLSLLAAQFGWIGMLAFWLLVIVLVN